MPQDLYHYEQMVDRALRGVVREALERAAKEGLRGAHHFFIGFATRQPGVVIPEALRERYPDDMTIVLQHQFWDLEIGRDSFSVTLTFHKQLERLTIPLAAVRSFADPSVNFALEFLMPEPVAAPTRPAAVPAPLTVAPDATPTDTPDAKPTAEVVTLDSFRKR